METKTHAALVLEGWKIGDVAFNVAVGYGDDNDPSVDRFTIGLFRDAAAAKAAAEAEIKKRLDSVDGNVYWWGEVEEGSIVDESSNWGSGYGWVADWSFEPDERKSASWMHWGDEGPLGWNDD